MRLHATGDGLAAVCAQPTGLIRPHAACRLQAHGPGAQPVLVVLQVLKWLTGQRIEGIVRAQDLLQLLQQWDPGWVSAATVEEIERYIEEHGVEFSEGEHLGGESENALFLWADASVSLVSV